MFEYVPLIVEHFDEKHYYKAMRISWWNLEVIQMLLEKKIVIVD